MSRAKQLAMLILTGVGILVLSITVLVRRSDTNEHLLAIVGLLGGWAVIIVSLPTSNGK